MPSSIDRRRSAAPTPRAAGSLRIDRVACTGHGICAALLPDGIELDEWGYPMLVEGRTDPKLADAAVSLCPSRALYWGPRD